MTRKIGALWIKTNSDNERYMTGVLETLNGDIRVAIMKGKKEKPNHPDYNIVLLLDDKAEDQEQTKTVPSEASDF